MEAWIVDVSNPSNLSTFPPRFQVQVLQHFTSTWGTVSLLGIRIFTGRQHQIRAHCAHVGHPSLTDGLLDGLTSLKTKRLKPRKMGGFGDVFSHFSRGPFFRFHVCFQFFVFEIGRFDFF